MKMGLFIQSIFFCIFGSIMAPSSFALDITGAGSSFAAPLYLKWAADYEKATGAKVNYQSIGSSAGIKQIKDKTIAFGASDIPLKGKELAKFDLMQFPTAIGGVVPVVNLEGIAPGKMKLTGEVLAEIYLGNITQWNDKKLQELNPELSLPNTPITVINRAYGSGTTFIFSSYLSAVSPTWAKKLGASKTIAWPVGISGKGNEGVSAYLTRIKGAIGFVESAYAKQNNLAYILMKNKSGEFVEPTEQAFMEAASGTDWINASHFGATLVNQPGKKTWPITGATYILIPKTPNNVEQGKAALKFMDWGFTNGKSVTTSLSYAPLPEKLVKLIESKWAEQIKDAKNKPLWP